MKVTLLVSEYCPTCPQTEAVWRQLHAERAFDLEVLEVTQPEGRRVVADKLIRTVPATLVDGELVSVGVPSWEEARERAQCAPPREAGSGPQAGPALTMARGPRHLVRAAVVYLVLGGALLVAHGDLLAAGPGPVHLFTFGFVSFMILGVAEHMLPRFTGHPVRGGWWAAAQYAAMHAGLLAFVAGRFLEVSPLAAAGGVGLWLGLAVAMARLLPLVLRPASEAGP